MSGLRYYMEQCNSRTELQRLLVPKSRTIEFNEVTTEEECQRQISTNMRFMKLALKEHHIPVILTFRGKSSFKLKWRYPDFGHDRKASIKVPQLLQLLHMVNERLSMQKTTTVRDIYYGNVQLFESQRVVETLLSRLERMFDVEKQFFHIVSTQKGLIYCERPVTIGSSNFYRESQLVPYMDDETKIVLGDSAITKVIVLEKDAIFQQLIQCKSIIKGTIIITGKGYPDLLSRNLLCKMDKQLPQSLEIHIYTDSDPYGIDIVTKYMSHPTLNNVQCARLKHKGVLLTQLIRGSTENYKLLSLSPLSLRDTVFGMNLLNRLTQDTQIRHDTKRELVLELQHQLFFQRKGEMNVANNGDVSEYFSSTI